MIDPDSIIIANKNNNNVIEINNIPEFDYQIWNLEDEKELKKYFATVEKEVRQSYEYREMIQYLRNTYNMDTCAFIKVSNTAEVDVKIEIHHTPFTLYDIVTIVFRKREFYGELLEVQLVAKEVTMLHYKLLIGLIPLSKTVHQLVHNSQLFIPVQNVLGNYRQFVDLYKPFCDVEQLETLDRIEAYSTRESNIIDTSILDMNVITFKTNNSNYQLPDLNAINTAMNNRIQEIKNNDYRLPLYENAKECNVVDNQVQEERKIIKPFYFIEDKK